MLNMIDESTVGFIGLGAMGAPMAIHLAEKLPSETKIYAFDVVQSAVDQLVEQFPGRVFAGNNARDVAEKSVRFTLDLSI
jgi:3-hydroxyisobutyrate dehydrogenase